MRILGLILLPLSALVGVVFILRGMINPGEQTLAVAGAILVAGVLLAGRSKTGG